ncbi:hypothetical protein [Mycobacterium kubicae]|uniref:hypothetical protein n=1 Tax=Mycobacterium kubicae TaxID=120959 RepID=UPI000E30DE7D|nr:hypothetical protein [Mycobacterium kubicae]
MELIMSTRNIVLIVIAAVVAIVVIALLAAMATRAKRRRQLQQAEQIREQARIEQTKVQRREALAEETAAKARAAQAEAEAKAAEAARLHERAATHQSEVTASREQLEEQWQRADSIDPTVRREKDRDKDVESAETDDLSRVNREDQAYSQESPAATTTNLRESQNHRGPN